MNNIFLTGIYIPNIEPNLMASEVSQKRILEFFF